MIHLPLGWAFQWMYHQILLSAVCCVVDVTLSCTVEFVNALKVIPLQRTTPISQPIKHGNSIRTNTRLSSTSMPEQNLLHRSIQPVHHLISVLTMYGNGTCYPFLNCLAKYFLSPVGFVYESFGVEPSRGYRFRNVGYSVLMFLHTAADPQFVKFLIFIRSGSNGLLVFLWSIAWISFCFVSWLIQYS